MNSKVKNADKEGEPSAAVSPEIDDNVAVTEDVRVDTAAIILDQDAPGSLCDAQGPGLITTPTVLSKKLERLGAEFDRRVGFFNRIGLLQDDQLLCVDDRTRLQVAPWGQYADAIKSDEVLQQRIAILKTGEDDLHVVVPDFTPGSLERQIEAIKCYGIDVFLYGFSTSDVDNRGDVTAFDPSIISTFGEEPYEPGKLSWEEISFRRGLLEAFTKRKLLESGAFGSRFLPVRFVDSARRIRLEERHGMTASMFVRDCKRIGVGSLTLEIYIAMQADIVNVIGEGFDMAPEERGWLNGFSISSNMAISGRWNHGSFKVFLPLELLETRLNGGRRSVKVFPKS